MKRIIHAVAVLALLALPALAAAETWSIDADHSSVGFTVRHMMVSNVKGSFGTFSGTVEVDEKDIAGSKVSVTIDAASINTGVAKRDEHLRSADFFDTARYPTVTYVSKKVEKSGKDRLKVYGNLTLRGVTRPVVLDVEGPTAAYRDPWGKTRRGASATATINRRDFGLTWNKVIEAGGVLVGDEVKIILEMEFIRK
ncbi:MAG TPA: YceI family protein [Geobacteraceae bacterium]|nr:YceI family protein [Geobacteraceae bacterium]